MVYPCPSCKGSGQVLAHVAATSGHRFGEYPCDTCGGAGAITEDHARRIVQGQALREDRLARGMTLRREAERLGLGAAELSARESGRAG